MNPYQNFVAEFSRIIREAKNHPLGGFPRRPRPTPRAGAPRALIFAPHPDDEVIIGALPLRLQRELGWEVIDVAVTQGSNPARRSERWSELSACCDHIGFGLISARAGGLEGINLRAREENPEEWQRSVETIRRLLAEHSPRAIFFPHSDDWNITHIGTHYLVLEALGALGSDFSCIAVETEFWGAMNTPNLMVESGEADVVELISALSFHVGEVKRNPYHLRLPAWLMDNVRRGGELVGGQGKKAPDFTFSTLYRAQRWCNGKLEPLFAGGRFLSQTDDPGALFA